MTIESKRRYVLLKLLEELHKQYSFNFISKNDGSTSQADKNENKKNQDVYYNESDLEQESLEEFKQKYIIDFLL
jgi:hypothetical protein